VQALALWRTIFLYMFQYIFLLLFLRFYRYLCVVKQLYSCIAVFHLVMQSLLIVNSVQTARPTDLITQYHPCAVQYEYTCWYWCRIYGFYDECKRRYNIKLWKTFTDCFNCLPIGWHSFPYIVLIVVLLLMRGSYNWFVAVLDYNNCL